MATMQARITELSRRQIAEFFSDNVPTTQEQCNQAAERILGRRVRPAPVQGSTSYTVVPDDDVGERVVQYRASDSSLDLDFLRCIEQTYGRFVPRHWDSGSLSKLHIYTMDNVGGVSVYLALNQLHGNHCYLLRQTLQDFASFFASTWHNTPVSIPSPSREELYSDYSSRLFQLSRELPERFRPTLKRLISNLPGLFAEDWPLVPNHTDLLENNIHVHRETGHITGICDWKDTTISPFGTSLGGLETLLGIRTREDGWRYHVNQGELRDLFWKAFYSAMGVSPEQMDRIEDARLVGIFLDNGFVYVNAEDQVPVSEGSFNLKYLEAVTLRLWASTGH
ncbi:hypothetical protein QQX98_013183 [Neonectria punicea]|uniref:Aminoglycoside phosphotransferase domain-containing protein n=1 Tax=Neonectria punicea TaxID=979145 RepID=A0ABR1GGP1_9HYPO